MAIALSRKKTERLGWIDRARQQLNELEDRLLAEIAELPRAERQSRQATFRGLKNDRLAQLAGLAQVLGIAAGLVGTAHVTAGVTLDQLGYEPNAEMVAVGKVIAELKALNFTIDDRQTAGVGYDLLARHRDTGEQRCVEVKGFTDAMGPVWLEQNEWAQALQRGDDYWLYVVDKCALEPTVRVRAKNPAEKFGGRVGKIQRFQIKLSHLQAEAAQQ